MNGWLWHALFWASSFLVAYPYAGYPLLMSLLARRRIDAPLSQTRLPTVSVIIAAHNEDTCIGRKIVSTLSQDYPPEKLEIIVISDGSSDRTVEVAASFVDRRVHVLALSERRGKSLALNQGVEVSTGEVLVFTDANALFAADAIRRLAEPLRDPSVGLVSGQGLYGEIGGDGTARAVANGYVRLEALIKAGESVLGFVGGADGAIYAVRRSIYRDLAANHVNDLLHPIHAALNGYVSRFDGGAYTVEPSSAGAGQEFRRHVRIIAQGFTILALTLPLLIRVRRWRVLWILASHRVLRWFSAVGLGGALVASALTEDPFLRLLLVPQALFYGAALAGWVADRSAHRAGKLALPYYFCVVSIAGLFGFARFLRGQSEAVWSPHGASGPSHLPEAR